MIAPSKCKLRFPAFTKGYKPERFSNLTELRRERLGSGVDLDDYVGIGLEDIESDTGRLLKTVSPRSQKGLRTKFYKNDVLYGSLRPYLRKFYQPNFEGVCGTEIWVLKPTNVHSGYLYYLVQSDKFSKVANIQSGSRMPRGKWSNIAGLMVALPSWQEQDQIADFLSVVDEKIGLLEKKKELLEKYKWGVMQQLFSQKVRFKDEGGKDYPDWEKVKLGDVFSATKGTGLSKSDIDPIGKNACVLYGELYTTYSEQIFDPVSRTNKEAGVWSEAGDLLIPTSTTTTGIDLANVTLLPKAGVLVGADIIILRSQRVWELFYAYYLTHFKKFEIARCAQGSTIVHVCFSHIEGIVVDVPSINEQKRIASFISAVDEKLDTLNRKIELYKTWKKGLLQRMFV